MVSMNDVPINDLIEKAAESLKKVSEIKPPAWASYAKTGMHKERPPVRNDWWYIRAAAVLKKTAKLGPIGVSKLRTKYGGRKNRGHKPDRFYKGSGNVIRKILQQLEKAQLVKQIDKDGRKGRIIAPKGVSLLNKAALEVNKAPKKKEAEPAPIQPTQKPQPKPEIQKVEGKPMQKPEERKTEKPKPAETHAKPAEKSAEKKTEKTHAKPEVKAPAEKTAEQKPAKAEENKEKKNG